MKGVSLYNASRKAQMIRKTPDGIPSIYKKAYIDPAATIIGNVRISKNVFVGPGVIIRADKPGSSIFDLQRCSLGILVKEENKNKYNGVRVKSLGPEDDLTICAANFFSILREFDEQGVNIIIAEGVEEKGFGWQLWTG